MNKAERRRVYDSPRWKRMRKEVAEWTGETCEMCGGYAPLRSEGGARGDLDHITPLAKGGAAFDPRNTRWLCVSCHSKVTNPPKYPALPELQEFF